MTFATKITVLRILLIPIFVAFVAYYGASIEAGEPRELLRWLAIATFIIASLSDALDGFIAKRFNQESPLGRLLDPIADKALMLAAIIALTLSQWPVQFPIWFAALVITKEAVTVGGAFLVHHVAGDVHIQPRWSGKACTFLQMLTVSWVMLVSLFPAGLHPETTASVLIWATGLLTLVTMTTNVVDGFRQVPHHHAEPDQ